MSAETQQAWHALALSIALAKRAEERMRRLRAKTTKT